MLLKLFRAEMFGRLEIDRVWQHQRTVLMQDFWAAIRELYLRHQQKQRLLLVDSAPAWPPTNYANHLGDTHWWPSRMNQSVYSLINSPAQAGAASQ